MQAAKQRNTRTISSRLRRIVLTSTATLLALWLVLSGYLFYNAGMELALSQGNEEVLTPAAVALASVMEERSATIAYLEEPDEHEEELGEARAQADKHMEEILGTLDSLKPYVEEPVKKRVTELDEGFDDITQIREQVNLGQATRQDVFTRYNALTEAGADLFDTQSRHGRIPEIIGPGSSATYMFRTVDQLSQADAYLSRSFDNGELTRSEQREFTRLVGSYRGFLDAITEYMGPEESERLTELRNSDDFATLTDLQDEIVERDVTASTDPVTGDSEEDLAMPVSEEEWNEVYTPVRAELVDLGKSQALYAGDLQHESAIDSLILAITGSLTVAVVTVGAFVIARRSSRRLVGRLHLLRDGAQELSDEGLPDLMRRLREHESVDTSEEHRDLASQQQDDEIGQVATSFDAAHRTAVDAVVRQTELRQGVNRVFLNIAHRTQTLVHRQLRLLDKLERQQEDPEQLTELFKLDHLATRSRRNAENLLILGGEAPGRTWHRPMPLIDVLRGAISESGDYSRVQREHIAPVALKGPAVADVIHLVAELVDNATTFSPPHTHVQLRSEQVPNGVAVEIEDRGLGMQEEEFTSANELLADPPEFDVMRLNEKMRLGLFVVSQLAQRHHIKVWLRSSPYGGVQAIVLLPSELISGDALPLPSGEEDDSEPASTRGGTTLTAVPASSRDASPSPNGSDGAARPAPTPERSTTTTGSDNPLPRRSPDTGGQAADGEHESSDSYTPSGLPRRGTPRKGAETTTTEDGRPSLPKRAPQENLAPQLYDEPSDSTSSPAASETAEDEDRSTKLRHNMAAFQRGTRRGREEGQQRSNDTEKET
ncbi:signal transduction histidine kinase [Haloactinospora alba]|uniref:histidine kinase n=1 Tax=Haloactinospora alba TaxID=405555 RepID=A0A543NLN9_9ACTN|nr:nitrate- and nitrite sensing domain-containing protein [Haloactinospora alba]TQN32732.1 signal transduction histidine kinase [Haloactinospora alba]